MEAAVAADFSHYVAAAWEELARQSVPHLGLFGIDWIPAQVWWGPAKNRKPVEVDVVAESVDGSALLLGSVKWESRTNLDQVMAELAEVAQQLPFVGKRQVHLAAWVRRPREKHPRR